MTSVLIIDDHEVVRAGLVLMLRSQFQPKIIEQAENEKQSLPLIRDNIFDLIFFDLNMPESDPVRVIHYIKSCQPTTPIIVFTMQEESIYARRFYALGVKGFINKASANKEILQAVQTVMQNRVYISSYLKELLAESVVGGGTFNPFDVLSDREFKVTRELIGGKTIAGIAVSLSIDKSTVSTYKGKIYEKLGIPNNNLAELIEVARMYKLI
jgi:DNA-binding NarL/FixJ family response regulator